MQRFYSGERSIITISSKKKFDAIKAYKEIRKWGSQPLNQAVGKGNNYSRQPQGTVDMELDDITVERISNLDQFLSTTRENLDLIILVREALRRIEGILCKMRTISERAASDKLTSSERTNLQEEIDNHIAEIDHIAAFTEHKAHEIIGYDDKQSGNNLH